MGSLQRDRPECGIWRFSETYSLVLGLEERDSTPNDVDDSDWDHRVIICAAYSSGGRRVKEVIFDWWGDSIAWNLGPPQSGGPPDAFRRKYKYPAQVIHYPYYMDCHGNRKTKNLPKPGFSCCLGRLETLPK